METHKRLQLFATAIALQQMHGREYAQFFLEEQGVGNCEARKVTFWAADALPRNMRPEFDHEFQRAAGKLLDSSEFSGYSSDSRRPDSIARYAFSR